MPIDAIDAYLGRQPIVDRSGQLIGYELVPRRRSRGLEYFRYFRRRRQPDQRVGFAGSLGRFRGSINVCAEFALRRGRVAVAGKHCARDPGNRAGHAELLSASAHSRRVVFPCADDFTEETADNAPFLDVVDYIKVDILAVPEQSLGGAGARPAPPPREAARGEGRGHRCLRALPGAGVRTVPGVSLRAAATALRQAPDPQRSQVLRLLKLVMSDAAQPRLEEELAAAGVDGQPAAPGEQRGSRVAGAHGFGARRIAPRRAVLAAWLQLLIYGVNGSIETSALFRTAAVRARLRSRSPAECRAAAWRRSTHSWWACC